MTRAEDGSCAASCAEFQMVMGAGKDSRNDQVVVMRDEERRDGEVPALLLYE